MPPKKWLRWYGRTTIAEALSLPNGQGRRSTELGEGQSTTAYGHRMPRCQRCKTDLPADGFAAMAEAGGWQCSCGEFIKVRPATPLAQRMVPGARWLVNEGALGDDGSESVQAVEPVLFSCMACGAALEVDGSQRTVTCTFCNGSNYLPDGLWLRLHPQQTVRTFFVVCELSGKGLPRSLQNAMARSDDDEQRARLASKRDTPVEILERLARDDSWRVRRSVVRSGRLPTEALEKLVKGERNDEVLKPLLKLPLEQSTLALLAGHRWEDQRRIAAQHPATPDSLLMQLSTFASGTVSSMVLRALDGRELSAEVLSNLSRQDPKGARQIAARKPQTPAADLIRLAGDDSAKVRRVLTYNPALPPAALIALARDADERVAAGAKEHPAYEAAVAANRSLWMKRAAIGAVLLFMLGSLAVAGLLVAFVFTQGVVQLPF